MGDGCHLMLDLGFFLGVRLWIALCISLPQSWSISWMYPIRNCGYIRYASINGSGHSIDRIVND
jgi:hypothetical protein